VGMMHVVIPISDGVGGRACSQALGTGSRAQLYGGKYAPDGIPMRTARKEHLPQGDNNFLPWN